MFNKKEMIIGIGLALFAGFAAGYSKSREICMEAIANGLAKNQTTNGDEH